MDWGAESSTTQPFPQLNDKLVWTGWLRVEIAENHPTKPLKY